MAQIEQAQGNVYYAPWERTFGKIVTPFEELLHHASAGGIVLLVCAIAALIIANSPLAPTYEAVLDTYVGITIGDWSLKHSVHHWINDGLMAVFFFLVGLEIKREVQVGELADLQAAALPVIAAIGGMVAPALIYFAVVGDGPGARGWGVPMATDIAFAVGILSLLSKQIPKSLPTFLVAVAIVDDMGAVAVIALFYTEQLNLTALIAAAAAWLVMMGFNRMGIRNPLPYAIVGILMWMAMLESGVHATIAGILAALAIPARAKYDPRRFIGLLRKTVDRFEDECTDFTALSHTGKRRALLQTLENGVHLAQAPLQRLEHALHKPVSFFIVPLFALANAGVPIELDTLGQTLTNPTPLGVMLGLLVGKVIGIGLVSLLAIRLGIARMPAGARPAHIIGVALLGGIGFTMSIFIAELAFEYDEEQLVLAKTGILFASLIAGTAGFLLLRSLGRERSPAPEALRDEA